MKKVFAATLALIFVLIFPVFAEDIPFSISISGSSVYGQDTACVVLRIDENEGISAAELNFIYDSTYMSFSSANAVEEFPIDALSFHDNGHGQVRIVFTNTKDIIYSTGNAIELYFKSNDYICQSDITINKKLSAIYNDDYSSASFAVNKTGTVSFDYDGISLIPGSELAIDEENSVIYGIKPGTTPEELAAEFATGIKADEIKTGATLLCHGKEYTLSVTGDTNGDGNVNLFDYVYLRLCEFDPPKVKNALFRACDIDCNGVLTVTDYVSLKFYLLGINSLN